MRLFGRRERLPERDLAERHLRYAVVRASNAGLKSFEIAETVLTAREEWKAVQRMKGGEFGTLPRGS